MKKKLKLFILRIKYYFYSKLAEVCRKKMARGCERRPSESEYWNKKRVRYLFKKFSVADKIKKEET